ncbi:hypothetical protein LCGC14_3169820 [marine sediment metagenome]|uniref:Uncharacterized protein n=1 Tax=marine sediment metagenome TaxID=412755 RepID=A0A0F8VE44_9ZZZZ
MGKDYRLIVGVNEAGEIIEVEEPERFNAFCSLNTIEEHLRMLTALDKEMLIEDFTDSINCIYEEVYALRAYITGREQ